MSAILRSENGALFRKISLWYMGRGAIEVRYFSDSPPFSFNERNNQMAAKTKTITVQVDERLAAEIEGTTVHN